MNKMKIISIICIILWCLIIFYASSRTSNESNSKSKEIIYNTTKLVVKVTNKIHITNIDLKDEKWFINTTDKLNKPLRKVAHATIYLVLGILLVLFLNNFNLDNKKIIIITIIFCFIYSLTDEYHQTLVEGRTGQWLDCFIDTIGAVLGSFLTVFIKSRKGQDERSNKNGKEKINSYRRSM